MTEVEVKAELQTDSTANEDHSSTVSSKPNQVCCLLDNGKRCDRIAGNASFNRRIERMAQQKGLKLKTDRKAAHVYICDWHKGLIQQARNSTSKRVKTSSESKKPKFDDGVDVKNSPACFDSSDISGNDEDEDNEDNKPDERVDFTILSTGCLKRYRAKFRLQTKGTKTPLSQLVSTHFHSKDFELQNPGVVTSIFLTKAANLSNGHSLKSSQKSSHKKNGNSLKV